MTEDERELLTGEGMRLRRDENRSCVVLVQIGSADTVVSDLHFDLPLTGEGSGTSAIFTLFAP